VKESSALRYMHQDHLGSSSVATDAGGSLVGGQTYKPFGETWTESGTFGTDKEYTGQRLDGTGLYFYNARYYDAALGRFVSADAMPSPGACPARDGPARRRRRRAAPSRRRQIAR